MLGTEHRFRVVEPRGDDRFGETHLAEPSPDVALGVLVASPANVAGLERLRPDCVVALHSPVAFHQALILCASRVFNMSC